MTYAYKCTECAHAFDVIKSVKDIDVNEFCPRCESPAERQFVPSRVYFSGTEVTNPEWNPGLGAVVKSKRHREELAKRKGLIEVGNDFGSGKKMEQKFESDRAAKREKEWDAL